MTKSEFMHHILCESPFIFSRDFYAIRPLNLWHILGAYFLLIWGVGVVEIIFRNFPRSYRAFSARPTPPAPDPLRTRPPKPDFDLSRT